MADMIEHSNFVSMFHLKQEWEDEMVKEQDDRIKMGLKEKCMNCHKAIVMSGKIKLKICECIHPEDTVSTYWGF